MEYIEIQEEQGGGAIGLAPIDAGQGQGQDQGGNALHMQEDHGLGPIDGGQGQGQVGNGVDMHEEHRDAGVGLALVDKAIYPEHDTEAVVNWHGDVMGEGIAEAEVNMHGESEEEETDDELIMIDEEEDDELLPLI